MQFRETGSNLHIESQVPVSGFFDLGDHELNQRFLISDRRCPSNENLSQGTPIPLRGDERAV
jgi:hypothetical protein